MSIFVGNMDIESKLDAVSSVQDSFPCQYAAPYTRACIAAALAGSIWRNGSFRLGNLAVKLEFCLPENGCESYETAVEAGSDYLDGLGLTPEISISDSAGEMNLSVEVGMSSNNVGEPFQDQSYRYANPIMLNDGLASHLLPDLQSWIVYIPFDPSSFELGGSLYAGISGREGEPAPQVADPDYFLDCYEVVREFVEDGVALSGCTVWRGGLAAALRSLSHGDIGINADLSDLSAASGETDSDRLLFAEVPGVLLQIRDSDFDYIDAELLLQDVAFYPLGHPALNGRKVNVEIPGKNRIQSILDSLINYC